MASSRSPAAVLAAAQSLRSAAATAELSQRLQAADVAHIILKGISFERWLAQAHPRVSGDIDVVVSPQSRRRVARLLRDSGYSRRSIDSVATTWCAEGQPTIDVHQNLKGVGRGSSIVWEVLSAQIAPIQIGSVLIPTLSEPALALHCALHTVQSGLNTRAQRDLERAAEIVSEETWCKALDLADQLSCRDLVVAAFSLTEPTSEMARRLGLMATSSARLLESFESPHTRAFVMVSFQENRAERARQYLRFFWLPLVHGARLPGQVSERRRFVLDRASSLPKTLREARRVHQSLRTGRREILLSSRLAESATATDSVPLDFVVIGAQKSGTTSLHSWLEQHPEIFMPPEETPDFEDPFYSNERVGRLYRQLRSEPARIRGIKRPDYLALPEIPERLNRWAPDAKFILVLRNPIDRATSSLFHYMRLGYIPVTDVNTGLRRAFDAEHCGRHPAYGYVLDFGRYGTHISRWLSHVSADRFLIATSDQLRMDPEGMARTVFEFLGADSRFVVKDAEKHHYEGTYNLTRLRLASRARDRVVRYDSSRTHWERDTSPRRRKIVGALSVIERGVMARLFPADRPAIEPELRLRLAEFFAPDVQLLQELVPLDLSPWRDFTVDAARPGPSSEEC